MEGLDWLTQPELYSREQICAKPCPVPASSGIYGWFFKTIPEGVPTDHCLQYEGMTLLYAGISPKQPPTNGKPPSSQNLRKRIQAHYGGNAKSSTLRRTLGCLLASQTGYPLRRVGSGTRMTLTHAGEQALDHWMAENAFVAWLVTPEPWILEEELIQKVSLPLNLEDNRHHPFHATLSQIRSQAMKQAKELEIAIESGSRRAVKLA